MGTIEPENIKTILATSFKDFDLGPIRHASFNPLLGDGIFTLDGAAWEHSRALLKPQFSREQVSDLESLEVHIQRLISCIEEAGESVDLQPLFYRLTLDSATEFLLGESVDSLLLSGNDITGAPKSSQNGKLDFGDAFNTAQHYLMIRARMLGFYWLINSKKFRDAIKSCHQFIDHFVDLALHPEKNQKKTDTGKKRYIFLDAITEDNRNPKHLRDQLLNILVAGRDTTASSLGFTFLLLAKHPRVFNKLRGEIIDAFGTGKDGNGKQPTFSSLKEVTYLRYVLNEALRLYPAVPLNSRFANKNTVLPVGGGPDGLSPVFVPKGRRVDYAVKALHLRKDIYGEDAAEFRPERWGEGRGRGWEYLPFNGGPRICLGQQYALTEASYTVTRLLQKYDRIELADSSCLAEIPVIATLTMGPQAVRVKFYPAKD